jgi:glycosyltransferase involved in cell wall biosynthesis
MQKLYNKTRPVILLSCFLGQDKYLDILKRFASQVEAGGGKLVAATSDAVHVPSDENLGFELLPLPAFLGAYDASPYDDAVPFRPPYETWLAEVDSVWWGNVSSDSVRSLQGLEHCKQVARDVIDAVRPSFALLWSSGVFPVSRVWHDVARQMGVPAYCLERGFLPGTWMVDASGTSAQADPRANPVIRAILLNHEGTERISRYRDWYRRTKPRKYGMVGEGADWLRDRLGIKGRLVVILGELGDGTTLPRTILGAELNQPGYTDARDIVRAVDNALKSDENIDIVFKAHPGKQPLYTEDTIGRVRVVRDCDAIDLIEAADVVVAGQTTLAYETLLNQRPLVLIAHSALQGTGAAYEALQPEEIGEAIRSALEKKDQDKQVRADFFLDALLTYYLYATDDAVPAMPLSALAAHCVNLGGLGKTDMERAKQALQNIPPRYSQPVVSYAQLFYDTGTGFNDSESSRQPSNRGAQRFVFDLDIAKPIQALRLDPINDYAIVKVVRIELIDLQGNARVCAITSSNANLQIENVYYFSHFDPWFVIDIPADIQGNVRRLSAEIVCMARGNVEVATALVTALPSLQCKADRIVAERDNHIADLHNHIADLHHDLNTIINSRSWRITRPLRFMGRLARGEFQTVLSPLRSHVQRIGHQFKHIRLLWRILSAVIRQSGGLPKTAAKTYRIFRREGTEGVLRRLRFAHHEALISAIEVTPGSYSIDYRVEEAALRGFIPLLAEAPPINTLARLICFYLPQFHAIPENDAWWGKGFTEWTNVIQGTPQFEGHYQPHEPTDHLGYYNLLNPEIQHKQVELAKRYGIGGFCFYFYWFGGKRLLETPVENYLADPNLDLPFCLCWANENWTRRWDGMGSEILIAQSHSPEDDLAFIAHIAKYMRDARYIRIGGKPLLLIYRPGLLQDTRATVQRWRGWCRGNGLGEIYLAQTQSFEVVDPANYGFDAAIEFMPNNSTQLNITNNVKPFGTEFSGIVYDWRNLAARSENRQWPTYKLFRGVCPSWDNTARRKTSASIFANSSPGLYRRWLHDVIEDTRGHYDDPDERLVFVNAWNEWAEGAHLEPDTRHGYAWLQATRDALTGQWVKSDRRLVLVTHDAHPHGAQMLVLNLARVLSEQFHTHVDLVCLGGGQLKLDYARWATLHDLTGENHRGEKAAELAASLYREGQRKALTNTTVSGGFLETLTNAGFECVALIHELGGVLRQMRLEESARFIAEHAVKVVFPADEVAAAFTEVAPLAADKIVIRPQGLYKRRHWRRDRHEDRAALRARLGIPGDAKIVLGMGYADYRKGIDLFVEAGLVAARADRKLHWVWVGHWEGGMQQQVEERFAADPDFRSCFHFPGIQTDTDMFYGGADVFALTSREDPFPSVVLEALDAGVPVVGFEGTGGCAKLLAREDCGRLVAVEDAAGFAAASIELAHDAALTKRLGEHGKALIDKRFSFRHYVFDLLDLLGMGLKHVSVVVPNYNYERYLWWRLSSIIHQDYPIFEIIFIDDKSRDNSVETARAILRDQPIDYRIVENEANSGFVFGQWRRGAALARGDLVWIAEADDSCTPSMLAEVVKGFDTPGVVLSYCESQQMNGEGKILDTSYRAYVADISPTRWQSAYVCDGRTEIAKVLSIKNTIPNVSAVVFDAACLRATLDAHMAKIVTFKVAGDWLVYVLMLKHGKIAFSPLPLNHHRRHGKGVTIGSFNQSQVDEIERMQRFVAKEVDVAHENQLAAARYIDVLVKQFHL